MDQTLTASRATKKYAQGSEQAPRTKNKKSSVARHTKNKHSFLGIEPFSSTSRNRNGIGSPASLSGGGP